MQKMVKIEKEAFSAKVPEGLGIVAYKYGDRLAETIADWLDENGRAGEESTPRAPLSCLLELGAVLQLAHWESAGFAGQLPPELPTSGQAKEELMTRAALGPQEFADPRKARLFAKVFLAWWEHFAWQAPELLDAEVLLTQLHEDEVIQHLARFFWESRHSTEDSN